ncbi:hypothetical protein [Streptomyces sp. NPDC046712]|uniref:hypothetical protein n=1 Tax=Streptomyces sp. NPDC046712 TaxID=3154802 RepID=UPI0033C667D6
MAVAQVTSRLQATSPLPVRRLGGGGLRLLFVVMAVCGAAVALWAALAVPSVPPLPRKRQTVADLVRRLADRSFLAPTAALAAATAALSGGVGFLPVSGAAAGLGIVATGAAVSVLAATAAFVQPKAGRALDSGRLTTRTGRLTGLAVTGPDWRRPCSPASPASSSPRPSPAPGTGLITPLGIAALAASTPEKRLGQSMGSAELGRELGDAGGPMLVAAVATLSTLTYGYATLALLVAAAPLLAVTARMPGRPK